VARRAFRRTRHPLDAYANCFVRRNRPTQNLDCDTPPAEARNSALAFARLPRANKPDDKEPR
jgi:hypothetical protein